MSFKKTTFVAAATCFLSMGAFAANIYQAPKPLMNQQQAKQCCTSVCASQGQNFNGNWFGRPCGKESCSFMCGDSSNSCSPCKSSCETSSCDAGVCGAGYKSSNSCGSSCGFSLANMFSCGSSCKPKSCETRSCVTNFVPERSYCGCAPRVA